MNTFCKSIKWQAEPIRLLESEIQNNQESHAYLFSGPKGCGKKDIALELAACLIRKDFGTYSQHRFEQEIYSKVINDQYLDVKTLSSKGASVYLIDQIRKIVEDAQYRPALCNHKIYIIDESEKLGTSAANALLKTLEEPPAYAHFILLTDNSANVLPTIVSRCQVVQFNSVSYEKSIDYVQKHAGCCPQDAKLAIDLYGGNTRLAIEFCVNQNYIDLYEETIHILNNIQNMSDWQVLQRSKDIVAKIDEISNSYSLELEDQSRSILETLDKASQREEIKNQKRQVNKKRYNMMLLVLQAIKTHYLGIIKKWCNSSNNVKFSLEVVDKIQNSEQMLRYNVNLNVFCDAIFLHIKETSMKWQK